MKRKLVFWIGIVAIFFLSGSIQAKLTIEDYNKADSLRTKAEGLVYRARLEPHWLENEPRFWYRNDLKGGTKEFVLVDAENGTKQAAFDHKKVAEALSQAAGKQFEAEKLPFNDIRFVEEGKVIEFNAEKAKWQCDLSTYQCKRIGDMNEAEIQRSQQQGRGRFGRRPPPEQQPEQKREEKPIKSPDDNWEAYAKDYNLYIRSTFTSEVYQLTGDGSADCYYSGHVSWSHDSKKILTNIVKPAQKAGYSLYRVVSFRPASAEIS